MHLTLMQSSYRLGFHLVLFSCCAVVFGCSCVVNPVEMHVNVCNLINYEVVLILRYTSQILLYACYLSSG